MVAILKNKKKKDESIWNLCFNEAKISFFSFKKFEVQQKSEFWGKREFCILGVWFCPLEKNGQK